MSVRSRAVTEFLAFFHRCSFGLKLKVMNPCLIPSHNMLEKRFITFLTLKKFQTSFNLGLLVRIYALFGNLSGTNLCEAHCCFMSFETLSGLILRYSAMSLLVTLRSSLISASALDLPMLMVYCSLACTLWNLLKIEKRTGLNKTFVWNTPSSI